MIGGVDLPASVMISYTGNKILALPYGWKIGVCTHMAWCAFRCRMASCPVVICGASSRFLIPDSTSVKVILSMPKTPVQDLSLVSF